MRILNVINQAAATPAEAVYADTVALVVYGDEQFGQASGRRLAGFA